MINGSLGINENHVVHSLVTWQAKPPNPGQSGS